MNREFNWTKSRLSGYRAQTQTVKAARKGGGKAQKHRSTAINGNGQHEMQSRGGGLAVRAARFTPAVEPQMRAVEET